MRFRRILVTLVALSYWAMAVSQQCTGPLIVALEGSATGQPVILSTASAGPDQNICNSLNASLSANVPVVGTGHWEIVSGPGTITFTNQNNAITSVTASAFGAYTLSWVIAEGLCENEDYVVVHFYNDANPANAGPDKDVCELLMTTLDGNSPSPSNGYWTQISGPSILSFSSITDPHATITAGAYGLYSLAWNIAYGPCVSTDTVVIDFCTPALTLSSVVISGNPYSDPGDTVTFQFTLTNAGKFTLYGPFNIYDDILGTIPVISSGLAPGQSAVVTADYIVIFQDFENGSVTTTAFATTIYDGMQYTSNTIQTVAQANAADLAVNLTANTTAPNVGEDLTFMAELTNNGPFPATGVSVEVVVANGFTDITNISNGGVFTTTGGLIRTTGSRGLVIKAGSVIWTNLTIPVGETLMLTFEATVAPPGPGVSYVNCAAVAGSDQYDPTSTPGDDDPMEDDVDELMIKVPISDVACALFQIDGSVLPLPDNPASAFLLTKINPSSANAGEIMYWQVQVSNLGPDSSKQVEITTSIPPSFQNREFSPDFGQTWYPLPPSDKMTLSVLPPVPGVFHLIVRAKVPSAASVGSFIVPASAYSMMTYDPDLSNNATSLGSQITQESDVSVAMEQLRPTLRPGDTIEYRITVTNHGPSDAHSIMLTAPINPALMTGIRYSVNGGAFTSPWTGTYAVGTLVQDAQSVIRIKGVLVNSSPLPNVNPVVASAAVSTASNELITSNNAVTLESQLAEETDVRLLVTAPATRAAGETIEYLVDLTNLSNTFTATDVVVTDVLPVSSFTSYEISYNNRLSWQPWTGTSSAMTLLPLQNRSLIIRAVLRSNHTAMPVSNTFTAASSTFDQRLSNNTVSVTTVLSVSADLTIIKALTSSAEQILPGRPIEYTLTFSNLGPSTALNVSVADMIPSSIVGPVTYSYCDGPFIPWTGAHMLNTMQPGDGCTIVIRGTIAPGFTASQIVNTATIYGSTSDPLNTNNSSVHTAQMSKPSIALDKTADKKVNVKLGETVTYTYKVTNTGNVTLSNVSIADVHNGTGSLSAITPASVASLPAGQQATFTATYVVNTADINRKINITNTATATATFGTMNLQATDSESVDVEEWITIGDQIWHDLNGDGQQNANEPGLQNVQVNLLKANGAYVTTKFTNAQGRFLFESISHGDYYLHIIPPTGFMATPSDLGNDMTDSDLGAFNGPNTTAAFSVPSGGVRTSVDAGFYKCAQIGDIVYLDANRNDVWNTNEVGINGIDVRLYRKNQGTWQLVRSTKTARKPGANGHDGYFNFCELPGQYYIQVVMPPRGLVRARPDIGSNEEIDSDITNANGLGTSNTFIVTSGQVKTDLGAGFYPMGVAGNLVWRDANLNGVQEATEERVAGVRVEAVMAGTGEVVSADTTDNQGLYRLEYLEKQDYYLRFYPPAGYVATLPGMSVDSLNSDVDHSFGLNTTRVISMQPDMVFNHLDMGLVYSVLPVEWLDVFAYRENGLHYVSWVTARESNVSHYEVERKLDGEEHFVMIGNPVSAAGNSSQARKYQAIDADVDKPGVYVYRLKQVDFDGQYSYSRMVKVSHEGIVIADMYPNPTRDNLNVDLSLPFDATVGIELFDAASKLVRVLREPELCREGSFLWKYSLEEVEPGTYTVIVRIDDTVLQKKIIRLR